MNAANHLSPACSHRNRANVAAGFLLLLTASSAFATTCPSNVDPSTTPTIDYTANGDGTVAHSPTALMWKQCHEGLSGTNCATGTANSVNWAVALAAAKNSTFAGYSDWRLPSKQELESLVDISCDSPTINSTVFPNTPSASGKWTWTNSTVVVNPSTAWTISFGIGFSGGAPKGGGGTVRLVRGGQSFDAFPAPSVPTAVVAIPGNAAVTLTFSPPTNSGTPTVTGYLVGCTGRSLNIPFVADPPIVVASFAAAPVVISGLTNGRSYRCSVAANSVNGAGSAVILLVTPDDAALPRQPATFTAAPGNGQIVLNFTPPTNIGGSAVAGYQVGCTPSTGLAYPATNFVAGTSGTVTALANDVLHLCSAAAVNVSGTGPFVLAYATPVDPTTRPGAPVIRTITAGDRSVSVTFDPPNYAGTTAIVQYQLLCNSTSNGFGYVATASPVSGSTLTNGVTYGCSLNARNTSGYTLRPTGASPDFTVTPNATGATASGITGAALATPTSTGNVVLAVAACATCTLAQARTVALVGAALSPSVPPPNGVTFPHGLVDYQIAGVPNGSTITMNVTYPQPLPDGTAYWKFGPTLGNATPHWYTLPTTITSNTLTFAVTDGGLGDDDMTANGSISDPGGAGMISACSLNVTGAVAAPNAATDGLLLLRYLLGFRGGALVQGVTLTAARPDALTVETFLANPGRFDVLGRTPPAPVATVDGVILLRLLQGVPDTSLLGGLTLPAGAQFNSASDIRGHVNLACGTSFPG